MTEQEQRFISDAIMHGRTLPFSEALEYFTGLAGIVGPDHPAKAAVNAAIVHLTAGDAQLDLLQVGQLKMEAVLQS